MLVIDARKAMDAGIGTYIQHLVPRVCDELQDVQCLLLLSSDTVTWAEQAKLKSNSNISFIQFDAAPFSLYEQILFRRIINNSMVFWATSMSHPLFFRGRFISTVHDVAQLALQRRLVGGLITKIASKIFFKSILEYSSDIIFVSQFSRTEFMRYVGSPKQRTAVVHLGVDSTWFEDTTKNPIIKRAPYFISVSSIRPHKNFAFLLKAFLNVAATIPQNLVIAGDKRGLKNIEPSLMNEVSKLGERIQFLGRISDADLKIWVSNADAMIFPSLYEGFGLPPVEAMATGCPVITSSSGAMKEICGDAAIYFDPQKLESLTTALIRFSQRTENSRDNLRRMGISKALEYDWSIAAKATANIIRQSLY